MPQIRVLEICDDLEMLAAAEVAWIAFGRTEGWPLTNGSSGGDGPGIGNQNARGVHYTDARRAAAAERMRGNKHAAGVEFSPERRAAIAEVHRGNTYSVGKKHTEEFKQAASERMLGNTYAAGRVPSQEQRDKQRAACLVVWAAKTPEELAEHAAKISATKIANGEQGNIENLRKGHTPEVRARAVAASAEARRGVPLVDEQKEAISESLKRAYAEGRRVAGIEGWSRKHIACVECTLTKYPHKARGYCRSCWERLFRTPKRTEKRRADAKLDK